MKEKIFLALSDQNLSKILVEHLSSKGYVVASINDGKNALESLKKIKPDLFLVDTVLPGKSGYEILSEKSFDKEVTKIPVIIISNAGEPIHMKQIPATPVIKDYIVKPHVTPEEVEERIEAAFGRTDLANPKKGTTKVAPTGQKILWVEDDKLLSTILTKKFESVGYTLLKASNSEQAFGFLETTIPNIIILDILLPGINGLDILQKIKTVEVNRKIPVLILSNLNKQSDIEKAKLLGANKFVVKAAVSLDEIVEEVAQLIKGSK